MEDGARSLLLSVGEDSRSPATSVEARLLLTPLATPTLVGADSHSMEFESMSKVLRSGKALRKGGMLLVPLSDCKGQIQAVLVCEKKLAVDNNSLPSETSHSPRLTANKEDRSQPSSISVLMMSESDEEVVSVFCCLVLPLLDKLVCLAEAYGGIQQAGQALVRLQQLGGQVEDRLAEALAQKAQLEETMRLGLEEVLASQLNQR